MSEANNQAPQGEARMRREIGVFFAIFIVINATIGTGIFKTPAKIARLAGDLDAFFLVWILGGAIALCGALSLAELASAMPRTGGMYEYLRRTYGPTTAFLLGWAQLTLLIPSAVGSFAKLASESIASLLGLSPDPLRDSFLGVGVLLVCASANLVGIKASVTQQAIITTAKYLGVVFLGVVGLSVALPTQTVPPPTPLPTFNDTATFLGIFTALVSVMWAYDGWADLSRIAGEVKQPEKTFPRALFLGTLAIIVVYLLANAGYARILGLEGLRYSTTGENMVAANLATLSLGDIGRQLLSVLVLISCVGCCMSSLLTGPRIFVAMATDRVFFQGLGEVSQRTAVPARAVIACAGLGAVYVMVRSFEQLTDAFVVGFFPFYMLSVIAVFLLRRKEPNLPRPFRVPGYPVVPILFLLGASALLVGAVADADRTAFFALGVLLLGLVVRWAWVRRASTFVNRSQT